MRERERAEKAQREREMSVVEHVLGRHPVSDAFIRRRAGCRERERERRCESA